MLVQNFIQESQSTDASAFLQRFKVKAGVTEQ